MKTPAIVETRTDGLVALADLPRLICRCGRTLAWLYAVPWQPIEVFVAPAGPWHAPDERGKIAIACPSSKRCGQRYAFAEKALIRATEHAARRGRRLEVLVTLDIGVQDWEAR